MKTENAGIIIALNTALPATVPIPPEKPFASFKKTKKKIVVRSSGKELEIAFIVAPLTPSDKFLPKYEDAISKPSEDFQMMILVKMMKNSGIITPIFKKLDM